MKGKRLLLTAFTFLFGILLSGCDLIVFNPKGPQAQKILDLINWSLIWIGLVVVVVIALFVYVVLKYRARPDNEDYEPPQEEGSKILEIVWTAIPFVIVILLTVPTMKTLFELEDFPEEYQNQEPLTIHVTSADWKWIFSYPEQNIETVNYLIMPVHTPVNFKLTSAGTMQSFWIPSLGGQKYTMANMEVELPLVADVTGEFIGRNTNFNGEHYAAMEFQVLVLTQEEFDEWVKEIQEQAPKLTEEKYAELLQPSVLGQHLSFSNTHLEFVNHADHNDPSSKYIDPNKYLSDHEYPGRTFENKKSENKNAHSEEDGGGHDGH